MKPNKPIVWACIAAIALLFSLGSCRQNMPDENIPSPLSIQVVDGGYRSDSAPAQTGLRSQDNDDYTTDFTAGDAIGVYAVKDGQIYKGIQNLKLTAVGKGSDMVWQGDSRLGLVGGVTYYAYYPYQATLTPEQQPNLAATDANAFFDNLTKTWKVNPDQSTQAKYTACDLMIAKGEIANSTLTFTMNHRMALAVMDFHNTKAYYRFSNTDPTVDDYSVSAPPMPVFDNGLIPWHQKDYVFRYLVNISPGQKPASLTGGYQGAIGVWECPVSKLTAGQSYTYLIGDPNDPAIEVSYNLQLGDCLLKDGILLSKNTPLDNVYTAAVRAVVVKVVRDPSDNCIYKSKDGKNKNMTVHAYAVALFDSNLDSQQKGQGCQWSPTITNYVGTSMSTTDFIGYSNTQTIKGVGGTGEALKTNYPACYWTTEDYESRYPAPGNSSGWFFPSCGQLVYLQMNKRTYEIYMTGAGGEDWQGGDYWSSSENSASPQAGVSRVNQGGGVYNTIKSAYCFVRALVAF